jgi:hypothetical protein
MDDIPPRALVELVAGRLPITMVQLGTQQLAAVTMSVRAAATIRAAPIPTDTIEAEPSITH